MPEQNNNPEQNLTFQQQVERFYEQKNEWRKMNGTCPISADIDETLNRLKEAVQPRDEALPAKVKASIQQYSAEGQTLEGIWREKMAEGADSVRVFDGEFGFFKGEEMLLTQNKPLKIRVETAETQYRQARREAILNASRQARLNFKNNINKNNEPPSDTGEIIYGEVGAV